MRTTPPQVRLASQLRLAVTRAARRLRQEAGVELSPSLTSALASIEAHGPVTPSELAACERVQRPTVTRVLARLAELDLIERVADPSDRRSARVSITPAGSETLASLRTRKDAYLVERLERLDDEDRELLERAAEVIERLLADEDGR